MTEEDPSCLVDEYRSRKRGDVDPVKSRRVGRLEVLTYAVTFFSGFFFGAFFVAREPLGAAVLWGLVGGGVAALVWALVRRRVPAKIPIAEVEETAVEESEGGWDVSGFILAAIVIPVVFVLGMLVQGWVILLIIAVFALVVGDPSSFHVAVAIACAVTVAAAFEFGVIHPAMKRWDIPLG